MVAVRKSLEAKLLHRTFSAKPIPPRGKHLSNLMTEVKLETSYDQYIYMAVSILLCCQILGPGDLHGTFFVVVRRRVEEQNLRVETKRRRVEEKEKS